MKITLDSLKIITTEYPLATLETINAQYLTLCTEKGLNPADHVLVGAGRIVLAGYVSYLSIYHKDQFPLYCPIEGETKAPLFKFTFNEEIYKRWNITSDTVANLKRTIFCNKMLWTSGKEVLTTLNDQDYMDALREIEALLMAKYEIDLSDWMEKLDNAPPVNSIMGTCRVFDEFSDMLKGLFIKEGLFISEYN